MIELTRTKKNLKLQSNTMKGIDRMNEELSREERLNSEQTEKERLSPSRIATLRYNDKTLPEEVIVTVCKLYTLGNMRLNEIVKRVNSTIVRSNKYRTLRPLTLPDIYAILYQEKKKPKFTTGKFNVLNSGFSNELSILQFIVFFTKWTYGGRFEECYQEMIDKVTSRNNPSRSFCHNTFKLLNRLFRQHKNKSGKKIRNRAYKTLFNDVFTKMRFVTINGHPALTIFFKDISHDAVNDIMNQIPGFGDVMKAYLEGQYEIDIEIDAKQLKLGKDVSTAIKQTAERTGVSEEVIIKRFHGEKEPKQRHHLLDPDSQTGYSDTVNLKKSEEIDDNIDIVDLASGDESALSESSEHCEDGISISSCTGDNEIQDTISDILNNNDGDVLDIASDKDNTSAENIGDDDLNILEQIENM